MGPKSSLANHLLIAMPALRDPDFHQSVIYVCEHHVEGTVGLIINRPMVYPVSMVFDQLQITPDHPGRYKNTPLLFGGPNQPDRGFVIHRPLGAWRSSLALREDVTVTTSNDIIRAMAHDNGPKDVLVTLGYVGWDENQLEQEILDNIWLVCPFTSELLYDVPYEARWEEAGLSIGVHMNHLASDAGHA